MPNDTSACTNGVADLSATFNAPTSATTTAEATYKTCKEGDSTYWRNDPLHVFQNSVMFSGFGSGNCWYMGRAAATTTTNKHTFRCNNMGAIAANTEMSLAFQFTVRNQGKDMGVDGLLANIVSTLSCDLTVNTRQTGATSTAYATKEWFAQTISNDVDGGASETSWSVFDEFWARPMDNVFTFGQSAQSAAAVMNAGATTGTGVDITAYVQLSPSDQLEHATLTNSSTVGATLKYRKFPWDSLDMAIGTTGTYDAAKAL